MSDEMNKEMIEGVEAAGAEEVAGVQSEQKQEPEKKYTDEDVDRIIARKIAAERQRALKALNAEQQESEIEKRERNVLIRELKADAKDALVADGFPYTLSELMSYGSKEEYEESYKVVTSLFREAVERGVKDRIKGTVPVRGYGYSGSSESAIKEAFAPRVR